MIARFTIVAGFLALAGRADAQRIGIAGAAQYAFGQYAEQGTSLRFGGSGPAGEVAVAWRRFGLTLGAARLAFDPNDDGNAVAPFDMTQTEVRFRVRTTRLVSVEAGFVQREVEPEYAAQSVAALRLGASIAVPLAIGADVAARAAYVGGSRFSGGGSAPFGVEVGLGVSYAPWIERLRVTGDLEFQRFDRRIDSSAGRIQAPIQSTMARVGVRVQY
jgi:hypothetical protein